jgi:hypothetical protein
VGTDGQPFVPPTFEPPAQLVAAGFRLEPLGLEHNERDHAAWSSSIAHIHATPGWDGRSADAWPAPMTLEENLADMEMHARHFREREGFTYTVLDPTDGDVVGCVYIYPRQDGGAGAAVRSWVRASRAELDVPVWTAVSEWLASAAWPFAQVTYAERPSDDVV